MSNETPPVDLDASVPFFSGSKRYSELNYAWAVLTPLQNSANSIVITKNPTWILKAELNIGPLDSLYLAGQSCQISMISDSLLSICNFGHPIRANGILLENRVVYAISFGFVISFTYVDPPHKGTAPLDFTFLIHLPWYSNTVV